MRLRRGSRALRRGEALFALLVIGAIPMAARAQTNSGALDLLKPIGARPTAMGAAYVAEQGGDAVRWNPAGIARLTRPEFAIDHFEDVFVASGDAANHVISTVDAFVTVRLAQAVNGDMRVSASVRMP